MSATQKTEVKFSLSPATEKPKREYRKGSKYDEILNKFIEGKSPMVVVEGVIINGKEIEANYLRTQLVKRITAKKLKMSASTANNKVYLEKEVAVTLPKMEPNKEKKK